MGGCINFILKYGRKVRVKFPAYVDENVQGYRQLYYNTVLNK